MLVIVRRSDGKEEEIEIPDDYCLEPGDILKDGSVIIMVRCSEEDEIDAISMGFFADEKDDDLL
ncbi:hypothetical protein J2128_001412 [Methanomicrobium sp. W14]|uniref:hypothetical protein n=1 Tax=Methanomicrobium sp. W14 TaxID=2817839 RepID=UPI001AEAF68F|nr:hypothetical protein [Methanomicrobium sp. W14]MBP2133458.1 hypothetical protein [Methanomicrobium sp. W14]